MLAQIFAELSNTVWNKLNLEHSEQKKPFKDALDYAIEAWCKKLGLYQEKIILAQFQNSDVRQITQDLWNEYQHKSTRKGSKSIFPDYFEKVFTKLNLESKDDMNFLLMIAFVLTAVGLLYLLLKQQQQSNKISEYHQSPVIDSYPPVHKSIEENLLLVVYAAKGEDVIKSLKDKVFGNDIDGEALYGVTKYLCLGFRSEFNQKIIYINNNYSVPEGYETIYDVYLVNVELERVDERFQPNVNFLDRRDAFCKLADLAASFKITSRLTMEAYKNFEVYS